MSSLINYKDKWGFIHIPKTGGSTIETIISDSNTKRFLNHVPIKYYPKQNYFYFSFVRNPYTRLLSSYFSNFRYNKYFDLDFFDYIKRESDDWTKPPIPTQSYYITNGECEIKKVSYIGKYENLLNDINKLLIYLNKPVVNNILHINRNPTLYYRQQKENIDYYINFYTDKILLEFINRVYNIDFEKFNYKKIILI